MDATIQPKVAKDELAEHRAAGGPRGLHPADHRRHDLIGTGDVVVAGRDVHALSRFNTALTSFKSNCAAFNSPPIQSFMSACSGCFGSAMI